MSIRHFTDFLPSLIDLFIVALCTNNIRKIVFYEIAVLMRFSYVCFFLWRK